MRAGWKSGLSLAVLSWGGRGGDDGEFGVEGSSTVFSVPQLYVLTLAEGSRRVVGLGFSVVGLGLRVQEWVWWLGPQGCPLGTVSLG